MDLTYTITMMMVYLFLIETILIEMKLSDIIHGHTVRVDQFLKE